MRNAPYVFFPRNIPSICYNHSIQMGKAPSAICIVFLQPPCCILSLASAGQLCESSPVFTSGIAKGWGNVSVRTVSSAILAQERSWKESDLSTCNLSASLEYLHFTEATFPTAKKLSQICLPAFAAAVLLFSHRKQMDSPSAQHCYRTATLQSPCLLPAATPQLSQMKLNSSSLLSKSSVKPVRCQGSK